MNEAMLFAALAAMNIVTPGPGVALTLTNAVRHSWRDALAGIFGVASGTFVVAALAVAGVGAVLMTSSLAFSIMKYAGAAYLVYLGIKMWRAPSPAIVEMLTTRGSLARRFAEGFVLQVTNPNAILFFLALFPQFIGHDSNGWGHGAVLVAGYAALVVTIHCVYAAGARRARVWLSSAVGGTIVNRVGGAAFVLCGLALAASSPRAAR